MSLHTEHISSKSSNFINIKMISKLGSLEEKIKLPPTETISRFYQQPQNNRKAIRILTVAVYVFCVSLAAIMLSLYYVFIWDPSIRPFVTKAANCDKIVIPEQIAIQLLNSSEISAEQFFKNIHEYYYQTHRNQYLLNRDWSQQNLQSAAVNKTPIRNDDVRTDASTGATNYHVTHHPFTKQREADEAALLESLMTSLQETHGATAPPINEKPSNYDDEDYSEDDSTLGVESSGFFPFNFEYNNRRKFDAD